MKRKSTGTNATALAGDSSRSRGLSTDETLPAYPFYALCVENGQDEYELVLRRGKAYRVIRPRKNDPQSSFRVVDEEGEDYLYPRRWFVPLGLGPRQKRRVAAALITV